MKIKVQSMKESRINSYRESDNEEVLMFKLGELQKNGKLDGFSIGPDDELRDNEVLLNLDNRSQCNDVFEVLRLCKSSGVIADFHKNADASFIVTKFEESKKRSKKESEDDLNQVLLNIQTKLEDLADNNFEKRQEIYPVLDDVRSARTLSSPFDDMDSNERVIKFKEIIRKGNDLYNKIKNESKKESYEGTYYYTDEQPYALIDGNDRLEAMSYSKDEVDQMKRTGKDVFGYPIDGCKFVYVGEGEFTESEIRAKLRESKKSKKESNMDKLSKSELEKDLQILRSNYSPNFELDNDPYGYGYFFSEDMGGENNLEDCIVIYPPKADADLDEPDKYAILFDPQGDGEEHYVDSLSDIEAIAWYKDKKKKYFGESKKRSKKEGTKQVRIARYGEFDNGHVLYNWQRMDADEAEMLAKEVSERHPDDVYYVAYDDIMNPDSEYRWINGKKYRYDQVEIINGKPHVKESKSKKESIDNNPAIKAVKDRVKKEFPDFEVVGPTTDIYDANTHEAEIKFYILVPEDSTEGIYVERMLQEIESSYPDFEYEGVDWDNKYWFNISKE